MMHVAVLNLTESVFTQDGADFAALRAAVLHTPSQVLPEANWSTVHDRWCKWTAASGNPTFGSKLDPDGLFAVLPESYSRSWKTVVMIKDSLMVNNNMVRSKANRKSRRAKPQNFNV